VTGRSELNETGEQVAVLFFGLGDTVMDHGCVTSFTPKSRQSCGICQQANPIFYEENANPGWLIVYMGNTKI
jgi:hypothetical protein